MSCPNQGSVCNCTGACLRPASRISILRANGAKSVHVEKNRLLIGGEEFLFPIAKGSISAAKLTKKYNALTLTILVGEVTFASDDDDSNEHSDPVISQQYRDLRDAEQDLFNSLVDDTF